jgi:Transposase, Mutator family
VVGMADGSRRRWSASRLVIEKALRARHGKSQDQNRRISAGGRVGYVHGISTRSVDDLVRAMGCSGVSKSQVPRLCADIDERVQAFLQRPIEGDWPYVWLDASSARRMASGRVGFGSDWRAIQASRLAS